ncbi:MAG: shikimate kinase [Chitinispirillaceae bacterium]
MKNITLIGMPGAGKSTLGVILAKILCTNFIDTDLLIQQTHSSPLQKIIGESGLEAFLNLEATTICSLDVHNHVIATGGSVVYRYRSMEHLLQISMVVFLNVPLQELKKRISSMMFTRGIVMKRGETLADLLSERLPLYRKYSHHEIDCSEKSMERIVGELTSLFRSDSL